MRPARPMRIPFVCLISIPVFVAALLFTACHKKDGAVPVNPPATVFTTPDPEDVVMYEVNINALSGPRTLSAVTDKLSDIKSLGINTIWLMPTYPVGVIASFGSPYCVRDYTSVNPAMGSLADLKNLVNKAHAKNIAVMLDWVANHTSWDHPWISAHPDWYTQDANGHIIHPAGTNWNDVADLNYNNSQMRLEMIAAMKYWVVNADIDGYRCDAADWVPADFWKQAIDTLKSSTSKHLLLLAEGARADHFTAGFQMNFSWDYLGSIKGLFNGTQTPATLFTTNNNEWAVVPAGGNKLRFTTNHDESNTATPITVYGNKDGALAASVITLFLHGVPLIYSGQEVGVTDPLVYNGNNSINWSANTDLLSAYTKLLSLYNSNPALRKGTLTTFTDAGIVAFEKTLNNETWLILANPKNSTQAYSVPAALQGSWTNAFTGGATTLSSGISLSPYQFFLLKK